MDTELNDKDILSQDQSDSQLETVITTLEKKGDTEDHDEIIEIEEDKRDTTDYSAYTKQDFVKKAQSLIDYPNIKEANDVFKKIRVLFDDIIKKDRVVEIKEWADNGNEVRDFKPGYDEDKEQFYKAYTKFLEKRAEEKKLAEEEKAKNLKAKQNIIEKLKELAMQDETESVFKQVRDIQKEWKQIRTVPKEYMQELWDSYRFYIDKFYDNLTINNELKELDRQKNLEIKIDLIKKVTLLHEENSIKKTYILLNKYHEDFKNAGPVPGKDVAEDIWKRFKEASDKVLNEKREQIEVINAKRKENLELKKVLCEKMELISNLNYDNFKAWKEKTEEANSIFNEWKQIGPVPESMNDQIWKRFRESQNVFNHNKKLFFEKLNSGREENLKLKIELCEQAEKLAISTQYDSASKAIISLQEKWKSIGPVPEKVNEEVWQRFRKACDSFFEKRGEFYKVKNDEEKVNQTNKESIIEKVEKLIEVENGNEAFEELKKLQKEWLTIGFVPFKVKNTLQEKYSKAVDAIYKKHKQSAEENKNLRLKEHFEMLASAPNGEDKLRHEERILNDKIKMLKEDSETLKNNIEFFAKSKNADALRSQIEQKVIIANQQISKLQEELKLLRTFKKSSVR